MYEQQNAVCQNVSSPLPALLRQFRAGWSKRLELVATSKSSINAGTSSDSFHTPHSIMSSVFWTIGCLSGASSVALGAFGAHGLKKQISDPARIANWQTAAQYHVR